MKNINNNLSKWSGIKAEFFNGVNQGAFSAAVVGAGAVIVAGIAGAAPGAGAVIVGAVIVAGVAGIAGAVPCAGVASQNRPSIRKLGYAFGLAIPIVAGGVVGTIYFQTSNNLENNITSTTPADCNCDAAKDEIKKPESAVFKIALECK